MTRIKQFITLLLASVVVFGIATHFLPIRVQAQSQLNSNQELPSSSLAYEPPPNIGRPGRREGAGTRAPCFQGQTLPTALVPDKPMAFGTTVVKYPTLFVYLPPLQSNQKAKMQFNLADETGEAIYSTTFRITERGGIASLSLPAYAHLPPLESKKNYQWSFAIFCAAKDSGETTDFPEVAQFFLNGWLQRIELGSMLAEQLKQATPRDRVALYAKNGVWYDALNALAELRRTNPNDTSLIADWIALLKSVKLDPEQIPPKSLVPMSEE